MRLHAETISLPSIPFLHHDYFSKSESTWTSKPFQPGSQKATSCLQPEGQCSLNNIVLVRNQKTTLYQKLLWEATTACGALAVWHAVLSPRNFPSLIFISVLQNVVDTCLYSSDSLFQLQPMPAAAVSHCWNRGGVHWLAKVVLSFFCMEGHLATIFISISDNDFFLSTSAGIIRSHCPAQKKNMASHFFQEPQKPRYHQWTASGWRSGSQLLQSSALSGFFMVVS